MNKRIAAPLEATSNDQPVTKYEVIVNTKGHYAVLTPVNGADIRRIVPIESLDLPEPGMREQFA